MQEILAGTSGGGGGGGGRAVDANESLHRGEEASGQNAKCKMQNLFSSAQLPNTGSVFV